MVRTDPPPLTGALEFQVVDWFVPEADRAARELKLPRDLDEAPPEYCVYMHGSTAGGHSVTVKITDFAPYFYVKLPERWCRTQATLDQNVTNLKEQLRNGAGGGWSPTPPRYASHLDDDATKIVWKKDFWGFTNGKKFPFLCIKVKSLALFQMLRSYFARRKREGFDLYESNIDPFIRFIHERDISPCGWVRIRKGAWELDNPDEPVSRAQISISCRFSEVKALKRAKIAPLLIAAFDIECSSSHGDFPVPKKDYKKLAQDIVLASYSAIPTRQICEGWIMSAFKPEPSVGAIINKVYPKIPITTPDIVGLSKAAGEVAPKIVIILQRSGIFGQAGPSATDDDGPDPVATETQKNTAVKVSGDINRLLSARLPPLEGDKVIQIGTTINRYGSDEIIYKHICVLGSCDNIDGADVESVDTEEELLGCWKELIQRLDPDILAGYNIFGFDMHYIWTRAKELEVDEEFGVGLGRLRARRTTLITQKLSSSALGDNELKYIDIDGCVNIDMLKVMQRDHKLDSYKLDNVAKEFLGDQKDDLTPNELFAKFYGSSADRCDIARYCIQDCALVNRLIHKLRILENNIGMGNVCSVPLSYLFMRGQGVKIFSLVSKEARASGNLIPVLKSFAEIEAEEEEEGYEGAIVLEPKEGIYSDDPIVVFDFSSLYPSSMIERNLSHDCYVAPGKSERYMEEAMAAGTTFKTVTYDIYEGKGDKKQVVGKKECQFAQLPNGEKGIIPNILNMLLSKRKSTRKMIEYETLVLVDGRKIAGLVKGGVNGVDYEVLDAETGVKQKIAVDQVVSRAATYDVFEQAVLDALQLAYKITANSLYGQIGSRMSQIFLKEIAAATTATGREMIYIAKEFMETNYQADVIYGDTDSIFCKFPRTRSGREALADAIAMGQKAAAAILPTLPTPQVLNYEKTMWPLVLLSKKRYVGNLYEDNANKMKGQKSMGIVLKRRDNAQIVKTVYGGIIDILMNHGEFKQALAFMMTELDNLVNGRVDMKDLVVTKTLRAEYKNPLAIAHRVLAERMGDRDAGNKPAVNDRVPYVYILPPAGTIVRLQGDRIEHPDYVKANGLVPDYRFYITNQIMKPVIQVFALCVEELPGFTRAHRYRLMQMREEMECADLPELKIKDKIINEKNRITEELLFYPMLETLGPGVKMLKPAPKVKPKTGAALEKANLVASLTSAPILSVNVKIVKAPEPDVVPGTKVKKASDTFEASVQLGDVFILNETYAKVRGNTKLKICRLIAEKAVKQLLEAEPSPLAGGVIIQSRDATFIANLRKATSASFDELTVEQKAVIKSGGAGEEIENICEAIRFLRLATMLEDTPKLIQHGVSPHPVEQLH